MAFGAIRALHKNGLLVPRLSTVIQSRQEMARRGVEILIDRIENGGKGCHEFIRYSLAQRERTRRLGE